MIIGIDLGTTNSLAACYDKEGVKLIPNRLGKHLTPSVVSVDENGMIYVGQTAKERKITHPHQTADVFKRFMGTRKEYFLGGRYFRPEELSSFVLKSLKEDAEIYLGEEVTEAVISVPAYFNDLQRKATKVAGEMAGFKVERIISEPTAAALSYGLLEKDVKNATYLVFDLGGGTFDVSILELIGNIMEVRSVAGDNYLGGEDFTRVLYKMFLEHHGLEESILRDKTLSHIFSQAEKAKIEFESEDVVVMKCKVEEEILELSVSMEDYEQACKSLLMRLRKPVQNALRDAEVETGDIDEVVLVGGSTRLRMVRKLVLNLFSKLPEVSINPDEAVALGVACHAALKERKSELKEVILTDVCPFTLGTSTSRWNSYTQKYESNFYMPIIERNTTIPASRTVSLFTIYDNQDSMTINIFQGEERTARDNILLGKMEVPLPLNKAGEEEVKITYTYDVNSLLEVIVMSVSTGKKQKMIIKNSEIDWTEEEIEKRFEELSYLKIPPREEEENKQLIFRAERMYSECLGKIRADIDHMLTEFEMLLDTYDKKKIQEGRKRLKRFLDEIEMEE